MYALFTYSLFIHWWTLRFFLYLGFNEWCNKWRYLFNICFLFPLVIYQEVGSGSFIFIYWRTLHTGFHNSCVTAPLPSQGLALPRQGPGTSVCQATSRFLTHPGWVRMRTSFILVDRRKEARAQVPLWKKQKVHTGVDMGQLTRELHMWSASSCDFICFQEGEACL